MNRNRLAVSCLVLAAACSGGIANSRSNPRDASAGAVNEFFPLTPGRTWFYAGNDGDVVVTEEVVVDDRTRMIDGVECTALVKETRRDGKPDHLSNEWFAIDAGGNVWKFGEESWARVGEDLVLSEDSWLARPRGPRPWMAFPANPVVGQRYSGYRPGGVDVHEVASVTDFANVPAGAFADCLRIVENPDDPEDTDIILYAPGVGRASETTPTGHAELVSFGTP